MCPSDTRDGVQRTTALLDAIFELTQDLRQWVLRPVSDWRVNPTGTTQNYTFLDALIFH